MSASQSSEDNNQRAERATRTAVLLNQTARTNHEDRRKLIAEVVEINFGVAEAIASGYSRRGVVDEDLRHVCYLALTKAAWKFDAHTGHDFLSYAVPTIRGELRRHYRRKGWMVTEPDTTLRGPTREIDRESTAAKAPVAPAPVVRGLPERDRHGLRLRFLHEDTQHEIADEIRIKQTQGSRVLGRVMREFRQRLGTLRPLASTTPPRSSLGRKDMTKRRTHLSLVDKHDDHQFRFRTLVGREPTPVELKIFVRWKVATTLAMPLTARKTAARLITRL